MARKIVITGPESTGKSTLAEKLASHYNTIWVPEYAREYIKKLNRPYNKEDLIEIAHRQLEREDELAGKANGLLFVDTDMTVIQIWYRHRFGGSDPYIEQQVAERMYDLYLLPDIDLPWKYDPQREHPHLRDYFIERYKEALTNRGIDYSLIQGNHRERLESAVRAIEAARKKW